MKKSIAKIALTIFIVVFISNFFIPAMPGNFVLLFGFLSVVSIILVIAGTKKFKIVGVCCLLISLALLISDYHTGKEYRAKVQKQMETLKPAIKDLLNGI